MCYCSSTKPTPYRKLCIFNFYKKIKKLTLYDLLSFWQMGTRDNVLIYHLLLVIPMSLYKCHKNACARTHTHTHSYIQNTLKWTCSLKIYKQNNRIGNPRLARLMRLFRPSAVAPCNMGVQYAGEVSPRLLIQPELFPCTFFRSSVLK